MTDDIPVNLFFERSHYSLHGRVTKLPDCPASGADRVMMMLNSGDAIHWGAIEDWQFAKSAGIYQVPDGSVDRRPAHFGEFTA
jgi:hypothetical protein